MTNYNKKNVHGSYSYNFESAKHDIDKYNSNRKRHHSGVRSKKIEFEKEKSMKREMLEYRFAK